MKKYRVWFKYGNRDKILYAKDDLQLNKMLLGKDYDQIDDLTGEDKRERELKKEFVAYCKKNKIQLK
jgi:hypothetical protein